jgi:carbamoyl-phosphate synthase small subunit
MQLVLEDGTVMEGTAFGAVDRVCGEVVFNTGMTGYVETLTDPSYRARSWFRTIPWSATTASGGSHTRNHRAPLRILPRRRYKGLVVRRLAARYSHHSATRSLGEWLGAERRAGGHRHRHPDADPAAARARDHAGWLFPAADDARRGERDSPAIEMQDEVFRAWRQPRPSVTRPGGRTILVVEPARRTTSCGVCSSAAPRSMRAPITRRSPSSRVERRRRPDRQRPGRPEGPRLAASSRCAASWRTTAADLRVCLGNQILALAAGGDTYKLPYGHRGVNQPVQDLLTRRCYITSQNHGYAVRDDSLPADWEPWFVNINDGTNEGIRSRTALLQRPVPPRGTPGPQDARFLFDDFLRLGRRDGRQRRPCTAPTSQEAARVLVLGSGALQIGQAGEFDYSGSQAIKALREEGVATVLVNPNIATIQTSAGSPTDPPDRGHARASSRDHREVRGRRHRPLLRTARPPSTAA